MNTGAGAGADTLLPHPADSRFDASAFEQSLVPREPRRWIGWRLRALVVLALVGALVVAGMMRLLAASPQIDATWQATPQGRLLLLTSAVPELAACAGRTLQDVRAAGHAPLLLDDLALQRTARWVADDNRIERLVVQQERLAAMLTTRRLQLQFSGGCVADVATPPRGYGGLGPAFWPLTAAAMALYLVGCAIVLRRPGGRNALYALLTSAQALNLLLIAAEPSRGIGQPPGFAAMDLLSRQLLDVWTAATVVCAYALHPSKLPWARGVMAGAIGVAGLWTLAAAGGWLPHPWWSTQGVVLGLGVAATVVIFRSQRLGRNPYAAVMGRFTALAVATLGLLTLAVVAVSRQPGTATGVAAAGIVFWYLFLASLLVLAPFLSRPRRVLREFALLAGIGTVATSLALVAVALFSLGPLAALMLALGLALAVYVVARRWIIARMVGANALSPERMFERLYRVAREVNDSPERAAPLLARLLHEVFEPLEMLTLPRRLDQAHIVAAGTALYVPLPGDGATADLDQVLVMRHAGHGKRVFTQDDARLAERLIDQVCRAVAHDRAVERGRAEERQRLAQDLHDDIGARLLTLMYKATDRDMEEYIRHTLQDLKTLTRGLATAHHTLAHAAGEWKADLAQRLTAASVALHWRFQADRELPLTVVQWSGLTRILRELVSNAIAHAEAGTVDVALVLEGPWLTLRVADDGKGGDPLSWSHGLGLGGVRKRVRALGGTVQWTPGQLAGISCEVRVPAGDDASQRPA